MRNDIVFQNQVFYEIINNPVIDNFMFKLSSKNFKIGKSILILL